MKKIMLAFIVLSVLSCQQAFAFRPEIIGGIRNGLAAGLMAEEPVSQDFSLRFGAEGTTGNEGIVLLAGGKFLMTYLDRSPFSLGVGLVGYIGTTGSIGFSVSGVVDRFLGVRPMFMEAGADFVANSIRLQLQLGYRI